MTKEISNFKLNIKPAVLDNPKLSSTGFLFYQYCAGSLLLELGNDTPHHLIMLKGKLNLQNKFLILSQTAY